MNWLLQQDQPTEVAAGPQSMIEMVLEGKCTCCFVYINVGYHISQNICVSTYIIFSYLHSIKDPEVQ